MKKTRHGPHYANHDNTLYYIKGDGVPFTVAAFQTKGDPIAYLQEDLATEQKARATYDYLMNLVHFQRFGEALNHVARGNE